jgi:hypothetical protein
LSQTTQLIRVRRWWHGLWRSRAAHAEVNDLADALKLSDQLLTVAAAQGKPLTPEIVLPITTALAKCGTDALTPELAANFWVAFAKLSALVAPLRVATLTGAFARFIRDEKAYFGRWAAALLAPIILVSIWSVLVDAVNADMDKVAATVCSAEPLGCASPPLSTVPTPPADQTKLNVTDVQYGVYAIFRDVWILNQLMGGYYASGEIGSAYKCSDESEKCDSAKLDYVKSFGGVVFFAIALRHIAALPSGVIAYFLPILYALLGACAYGFRSLARNDVQQTFTLAHTRSRARLVLALIVGLVIGFFKDFAAGFALSSLAIAFVAGYSVELFFSFLDKLVETNSDAGK